jgi:CHAT domain-containing protein/Tfp pilus assembly protein PilF
MGMKKAMLTLLVVGILSLTPFPAHAAATMQGEDLKSKADGLYQDGANHVSQGDYQGALDLYLQALAIYQQIGDKADEGLLLNETGYVYRNLERYSDSLQAYQQALKIRIAIGDRVGQGVTLFNIAVLYRSMNQPNEAMDYYGQTLKLFENIGDKAREERTVSELGSFYRELGQSDTALESFRQALALSQQIGNREEEAWALYHIALVHNDLKQYPEAQDFYKQSLSIFQETQDPRMQAIVYDDMGTSYLESGQLDQALGNFQQAQAISESIGDQAEETTSLSNLGITYLNMGDSGRALDSFQKALALAEKLGNKQGELIAHSDLWQIYASQEKYSLALEQAQGALEIAQQLGDRNEEGISLNNIAAAYSQLGQVEQAINYFQQSLRITQELGDRAGEGQVLNNLASLSAPDKSLEYSQQALSIARELGDQKLEAATLDMIGQSYEKQEESSKAIDYYKQALQMAKQAGETFEEAVLLSNLGVNYKKLGQYDQALEQYKQSLKIVQDLGMKAQAGITLNNIARLYDQQGDYPKAIDYYQQSIAIIENQRSDIKVDDLRASFIAGYSQRYEGLINALWAAGRYEEAFNYAERARSRVFLDQLAGGNIDFRAGSDEKLLAQEQSLRREISALNDKLSSIRSKPQDQWDTTAIAEADTELAKQETAYAQLLTQIKLQSPEAASLISVDVASLSDIQALLDPNTTLVEYYTMKDSTLAFLITHDSFTAVKIDAGQADLAKQITSFRDFANLDDPYPASLKQLYTWLILPLKDQLKTPVVGIIPHGQLHYLPFAALTDGAHYLGDEYSLFTLPSASALRFIQSKRKPAKNTILAFGNPTTTEPGLAPLKYAEGEAETIAKLYGAQSLIGPLATESTLDAKAGDYSVVHLAAHAQFNSNNPLFSEIFLAADKKEDGRLEVNEIYRLNLTKSTDLVVLSACETQVGAVNAGDEVVGMTRAFLYAGTPTVMASLWKVDDQATTLLMQQFYTYLRNGVSKSQALQLAQSDVREKYPNPYYWASFVLTGDPGEFKQPGSLEKKSETPSGTNMIVWILGIISVLLAIIVLILFLQKRKKAGG